MLLFIGLVIVAWLVVIIMNGLLSMLKALCNAFAELVLACAKATSWLAVSPFLALYLASRHGWRCYRAGHWVAFDWSLRGRKTATVTPLPSRDASESGPTIVININGMTCEATATAQPARGHGHGGARPVLIIDQKPDERS